MTPKLRKENLFLENDLNSTLQIHMYDFLYDQQEVYEYYQEVFEEKDNDAFYQIMPRNPGLPFAKMLIDFDLILGEFFEEKDMDNLSEYRWYCYNAGYGANLQEEIR